MVENAFSAPDIGWAAIAAGAAGLLGLVFLVLFFTIGQPYGTINDICIGLAAILSVVLAWKTFPAFHAQSPLLSQVALAFAFLGALIVVTGSVLVISGRTGWFLAGLIMAAGNGLIGLWLLGLIYSSQEVSPWPYSLILFGWVCGFVLLLGLASLPGIIKGSNSFEEAPWVASYIGQAGSLGYLLLYPIWCILLGRASL